MHFHFKKYTGRYGFSCEALGDNPGKVLDVGNLGDGYSSCATLKKYVEKHNGTYVGLDSNEALTKKLQLPNQVVGDLHKTIFDNDSFNAIYAGEIIEHTWTPAVMIQECWRILKPEGILILDTPNPYSIVHIARLLLRKEDSMGDNRTLVYHEAKNAFDTLKQEGKVLMQPQHKIFFTPAMLKQLLETQGFVLKSIGCTLKRTGWLHGLLLGIFPQCGAHLCVVATKKTIDEAFADVINKKI